MNTKRIHLLLIDLTIIITTTTYELLKTKHFPSYFDHMVSCFIKYIHIYELRNYIYSVLQFLSLYIYIYIPVLLFTSDHDNHILFAPSFMYVYVCMYVYASSGFSSHYNIMLNQ